VESVINTLIPLLSEGDMIIDGGNEWYENTEARSKKVAEHGLHYMGMGVSGGEDGARFGYVYGVFDQKLNFKSSQVCPKILPVR
jgi:6-phosphogluconate dehydrogenase